MHPDLVGPPRLQHAFRIAVPGERLQHPVVGDGAAAAGHPRGHLFPVPGMPAHGQIHHPFGGAGRADEQRGIDPVQAVVPQLGRQGCVGPVRLCRQHQAGRVLIQPVDDPRPLHSADPGEGIAAVMEQRIHQRAALMPGGGVNDHTLGLVDDQQVRILKEDIQRDLLRLRIRLRGFRKIQKDPFSRGQPPVFLPGLPLHQDAALFQKLLDPTAAEIREPLRQEGVQTEAGVLRRRGQYPLHPRPPSPLRCASGGSLSPPGER